MLIGGQSGAGKSTLIRNILAQSALQGGRFLVLDPHYGAGDESLGASLRPLQARMIAEPASGDAPMRDALRYVASAGRSRLQGKDKDKTPLILVVDELTALLQRSGIAGELTATLGQISQETRPRDIRQSQPCHTPRHHLDLTIERCKEIQKSVFTVNYKYRNVLEFA